MRLLDEEFQDDASEARPVYLCKVAYSRDWCGPVAQRPKEMGESHVNKNRFGHEDWLFRTGWEIDGWRYAFLQGVNRSYGRLLREAAESMDVVLFTVEPDKRRRYVAIIREVEVLEPSAARHAVECFRRMGWYAQMEEDIRRVGGNADALSDTTLTPFPLNIRFRAEHVQRYANWYASKADYAYNVKHYIASRIDGKPDVLISQPGAEAGTLPMHFRSTAPFLRRGAGEVMCTPEHSIMQKNLVLQLQDAYPDDDVRIEVSGVDVLRESQTHRVLYEIKSDARPLSVIRQALGQLLEYGFAKPLGSSKHVELVIVGRSALGPVEAGYLDFLVRHFQIPISYMPISASDA